MLVAHACCRSNIRIGTILYTNANAHENTQPDSTWYPFLVRYRELSTYNVETHLEAAVRWASSLCDAKSRSLDISL